MSFKSSSDSDFNPKTQWVAQLHPATAKYLSISDE